MLRQPLDRIDILSRTRRDCRLCHAADPGSRRFYSGNSFTPEQIKSGALPYNYAEFKMKIDELQGVSAFYKDKQGDVYHTYSSYARGIDLLNTTYNFLDLTARSRDEHPNSPQDWVRYHDEYRS